MPGGVEGVVRRREVTWTVQTHSSGPSLDDYKRPIAGTATDVAFRCAWMPIREARGEPDAIGRLEVGDRTVLVSITSLEEDGIDPGVFAPDVILLDEDGDEWGIRYVNTFAGRLLPQSPAQDSRVIEIGAGRVVIQ